MKIAFILLSIVLGSLESPDCEATKKIESQGETYDWPVYCPVCDSWHIAGCCPKGNK